MVRDSHDREQLFHDLKAENVTPLFVMMKVCNECLFSSKRLVDEKRAERIIAKCREENSHFICHKASINGLDKNVCCNAYFHRVYTDVLEIRLALAFDLVLFVKEDELALLPDRKGKHTTGEIA